MTTLSIDSVGLCAHFSPQGNWAFEFALNLARRRHVRLNIFHFLTDPFDPNDHTGEGLTPDERAQLIVERERELRFVYEDALGEYLDAGFRLCEESEWTELHRCLTRREFQVLVLPRPHRNCMFGRKPLDVFATSFVCPLAMLGPDSPDQLVLNDPAIHIIDQLALGPNREWDAIDEAQSSIQRTSCVAESPTTV